ncbi:lipase family protein [Fluviicola sp.]|uniref:lipase family protein n=1 Tax=Fluviicola sp. TaxID=1917219 RepID=UPI0031DB5E02
MSTISLPCKLLCASVAAYAINPKDRSGQYDPATGTDYEKEYKAVSFIGTPYVITDLQIEAALVGKTEFGIIVAFRGTLPPALHWDSILDWIQDFFMPTTKYPDIEGEIHAGFAFAFTALRDGIFKAVKELDQGAGLPVYITGHSKGGGIAPIAGMFFKKSGLLNVEQVITFAGPHPGNLAFGKSYSQLFPKAIRYENYLDIIPLLPPNPEFVDLLETLPGLPKKFVELLNEMKSLDYEPVGYLRYIDHKGKVNPLVPGETTRIKAIRDHLMTGQFSSVVDAHHPGCGYRYMKAVCGGTVCDS